MNYDLFRDINNLSGNGALNELMKISAKYLIFVAVVAVAVLCVDRLRRHRVVPVVATVIGLALTFVLGLVGAALYSERRPFQAHHVHELVAHAPGQSFPSDHATAAFGLALATFAFLSRRWGAALFVVALLIGFARVYVGIHYPGDIGGGFLAALLGVGLVALLYRRRSRPPVLLGRSNVAR